MSVTLVTKKKEDNTLFYVRVRLQGIDAKAFTKFSVKTSRIPNGKYSGGFTPYKNPPSATAEIKSETKEKNLNLIELSKNINSLKDGIRISLSNRQDDEIINSDWLKNIITPKVEKKISTRLIDCFNTYYNFKLGTLSLETLKKSKSVSKRIAEYEADNDCKVYVENVNKAFRNNFLEWLDLKEYGHNSKVKMIKVIFTVCNFVKEEKGILTHPELDSITKGLSYTPSPIVYLDEDDLKKIAKVNYSKQTRDNTKLEHARDWLLISCYTGQRVSDFFRFNVKQIEVKPNGDKFLKITQQKTGAKPSIFLDENLLRIMKKYGNDFPPQFNDISDSNKTDYNRLIKIVCKDAKLNDIVTANKRQSTVNRIETVNIEKWKAVSSHIGRRSFATNKYGIIPTALLISQTGHSTEKQLLSYIGKSDETLAMQYAELMKAHTKSTRESTLKVVGKNQAKS